MDSGDGNWICFHHPYLLLPSIFAMSPLVLLQLSLAVVSYNIKHLVATSFVLPLHHDDDNVISSLTYSKPHKVGNLVKAKKCWDSLYITLKA